MSGNIITLAISSLALGLSLVAFLVATRLKRYELERALRGQLGKLISELLSSRLLYSSLLEPTKKLTTEEVGNLSLLMQRYSALARQAAYTVSQKPELVSDVEFATIAQTFAMVGDYVQAEEYWQKSINCSPSDYYRVLNERGYASFLFNVGKYEQARCLFQAALSHLPDDTDYNKFTNGNTCQALMQIEADNSQFAEAERWYFRAKGLFESIGNVGLKRRTLGILEMTHDLIIGQQIQKKQE